MKKLSTTLIAGFVLFYMNSSGQRYSTGQQYGSNWNACYSEATQAQAQYPFLIFTPPYNYTQNPNWRSYYCQYVYP